MSEVGALVENVLLGLAQHRRVIVLEAIESDEEEAAWIVKVDREKPHE